MKKAFLFLQFAFQAAAVTNCAGTSLFPKVLLRERGTGTYNGEFGDNFYEAITGDSDSIFLGGVIKQ